MLKFIIILFLLSGCGNLKTLIELSKEEKLKHKYIEEQDKSFLLIKEAILNNNLKNGLTSDFILKKYGEPVLIYPLDNKEEWVYKPGGLKLDREKIYLYFDKNKRLIDYKIKK